MYLQGTERTVHLLNSIHILQVVELASLAQLLPPCSPTVRNPVPDSSLKSCFSRLRSLQLLLPGPIAALLLPVCLRLQLLLPDCARFSCCSRSRPLRLLLPDCILDSSPCPAPGPNVLEHSSWSSRFSK